MNEESNIVLQCSNCRKELVSIMAGRPGSQSVTKVRAKCCYCNDYSFVKKVEGNFFLGSNDSSYVDKTEPSEKSTEDIIIYTVKADKRNKDD